jgi:hypothetical protein
MLYFGKAREEKRVSGEREGRKRVGSRNSFKLIVNRVETLRNPIPCVSLLFVSVGIPLKKTNR